MMVISIHALLAESDYHGYSLQKQIFAFLSTLSLRRATIFAVRPYDAPIFLSTLSLRRATQHVAKFRNWIHYISIHALLAESDYVMYNSRLVNANFYPRSPCGERRGSRQPCARPTTISIHALLAESDSVSNIINNVIDNFYPRSPCGERHILRTVGVQISGFLSTLSLRRATRVVDGSKSSIEISIHALLAESDFWRK